MARTVIPKDQIPPIDSITDGAIKVPDAEGGDVQFEAGKPSGILTIITQAPWWRRLWFALTNPLLYVLRGRLRW
jgi:hypothetical protein